MAEGDENLKLNLMQATLTLRNPEKESRKQETMWTF